MLSAATVDIAWRGGWMLLSLFQRVMRCCWRISVALTRPSLVANIALCRRPLGGVLSPPAVSALPAML